MDPRGFRKGVWTVLSLYKVSEQNLPGHTRGTAPSHTWREGVRDRDRIRLKVLTPDPQCSQQLRE